MSTALYRRYRPDTFADVVGQEHVTAPLMQALRADRVAHAYLFSGPRGCGKTTSARILARCLNCAEGPTDTPCGTCDSCVELARGGSGSVDVVEIDAASHNGVDDARELRERAAFAPARDRYKIFILDEAHMVTTQGFNALLKLVEEPPPHVRFVFATTEPDKVIGTIRSRTHHYPFRLVPPAVLTDYLAQLAGAEGVDIADGVLPLVVRAGGGSVRDSLSVLDQLIAGSDDSGVSYERAISLLGFTDATLLDDAVDAIAAADGSSLFSVVGRVVETGHEPRRFVEDLLERLRDLIVLAASGTSGAQALAVASEDQQERMVDQARRLGLGRASRSGDLVNDALTAMIGATSPRLHLELLCARLIAADTATGAPTRAAAPVPTQTPAAEPQARSEGRSDASGLASARAAVAAARESAPERPATPEQPATPTEGVPQASVSPAPVAKDSAEEPVRAPTGDVAGGPADSELVRRRWPEVLGTLERRRVTWAMVSQSAQVASVEAGVLKIAFDNPALASRFGAGPHSENLALAVRETLGLHVRVEPVVGPAQAGTAPATAASTAAPQATSDESAQQPPVPHEAPADDEDIADDDASSPTSHLSGADVIASMLGGTVVDDDNR
ncbi:DNA polymerase III subunit gamma and tau [Demequina sp.]|uniref:DNA polymerase III subunit gamma and tau n=1 Tax=Demequina sp. TaxID=2050685 RepID=UPI0025C5D381|nr:DNA polymerase III subunit gamma and tau [Demequina sp.]